MKSHDIIAHLTKECPCCDKLYRSDEQLQKHIKYTHKYQCEFCDKSFGSFGEVEYHDRSVHLTFECPYCDKPYRSNKELRKHMRYKHTFQCEFCDKSFRSFEEMEYHDRGIHLTFDCPHCDKPYRSNMQLHKHMSFKHKFQCGYCDKSFSSLEKLDNHDSNVHLTNDCPSCGQLFRTDVLLDRHMRESHIFRCPKCPKWFNFKEEKIFHIKQMHSWK
ncbi:zinc finger protein 878-like [Diabrotica virgifera virgifera]|uniref:C2H2-type domain-containing protein n=1 Tax=Diabrotica virgifera virgifera TaxID=50390 RepID=A0ABM5IEG2_DIAVI|nr:zinc finger protein 878-like [Diabrotica virgifera virgifera]